MINTNDKPVQTNAADASGNPIFNDSRPARDASGRFMDRASALAEAAQTSPESENVENTESQPEKKESAAEARKLFLEAQKAKRKNDEDAKRISESMTKVEAFEKAKALADSGEDPTALLRAAGLDPRKFYQDMTTYALSDKNKEVPEDPVQKELREHKERLDKYAKDLEFQANTIREKEDLAVHNQNITTKVIPLLEANPDRYETLLTEYGANAAVEVYKTVWEIYQETGKARSFEEVADEMEKYWEDQVESGIKKALSLKKFQNKYAQRLAQENRETENERQETPISSKTLSTKQSISSPRVYENSNDRAERLKREWNR